MTTSTPMSGRRAEAARNDQRILESARAVFVADPGAPISAVAEHAGVGISALYRRYGSKEDLLRKLCADGLQIYIAEAQAAVAALDAGGDAWEAFAGFMRRVVAADTHSLTAALAGTFTPSPELYEAAGRAGRLNDRLIETVRAAGALRPDVEPVDLGFLFEQMASVRLGDQRRTAQVRDRYLTLLLDALHHPAPTALPGPPPDRAETEVRWRPVRQPQHRK